MEVGDPDGLGLYAQLTVTEDGEHLICHECGQERRALGTHSAHVHGISAAEYRRRHGLSTGTSLASPATSQRFREHVAKHPQMLEALKLHGDQDRARASMTPKGQARPQRAAVRAATGARARRGRELTPGELSTLTDVADLRAWTAAAREIVQAGATAGSIARALGLPRSTVLTRLRKN